jgi:pimeloyl-ACP methyl ester carboxylesterase
MPLVPTRAGEVAYEVKGDGVPVVMLHATLHDRRDYEVVAEHFAKKYKAITVDWPWHGDSKGASNTEYLSAVGFADVLEDVVEGLELEPAIFIGNSVGGFAAARLAISQPARVRALVLVNSGGFVEWTPVTRLFTRLLGSASVSRLMMPHLVRRYMSPQTNHDEEITRRAAARAGTADGASIAAALWRSFLHPEHNLRPRAENLKAPVLLVWGTRDPIFPKAAGVAAQRCISGSKLEYFDAGHVVFSSKPDEFQGMVDSFIESVVDGRKGTA